MFTVIWSCRSTYICCSAKPRRGTDCRGSAPLKPTDGLNGPPIGLIGPHARETKQKTLADALKSLKQGVSRRLIADTQHFWQKRYYDFNIRNYAQFVEKLRYIHRNPVKVGLCERPEDWEWSRFRHYATGCEGRVEIESERTARKRERAVEKFVSGGGTAPLKPKDGLSGPRPSEFMKPRGRGLWCPAFEHRESWGILFRDRGYKKRG